MNQPRRVVIIGGGFAGAYCAQRLERTLKGLDAKILLINRHNYFVFYPLLVEAGTGGLEPRHAVVSIRSFLNATEFRMAQVTGVDPPRREVHFRIEGAKKAASVTYDHLVVALGSVTRLMPVSGLKEYGFGIKSLADAVALRDRAIQMLERAEASDDPDERRTLLHFIVVGGNFTGVEVAGEFLIFLRRASRFYRNVRSQDCRVTLIEISDRTLAPLGEDLSRYATRQLRSMGVDVRLNSSVEEIGSRAVRLTGGDVLSSSTVIWCAGIAPPPLLERLDLPVDDLGYLLCEPDLRVKGQDRIWGIGDCAVNPAPDGSPYPATAQHAVAEGQHLAESLARVLRGREPTPFVYRTLGSLAALGCRTGVARVMGVKLSGFAAWFLWRTIYLMKMPGWSRRLRIALDWTADLFFRRDYVQLGIHRTKAERGAADPVAERAD